MLEGISQTDSILSAPFLIVKATARWLAPSILPEIALLMYLGAVMDLSPYTGFRGLVDNSCTVL